MHRQSQIYARSGLDLDRSTLAGWVGKASFHLRPVADRLAAHLKRSSKLFMDETRAPVLDPGRGWTKTGWLWALARDDRAWGGPDPPGVMYFYAPGRGGEHAEKFLNSFDGILQVDGYAGYNRLTQPGRKGGAPLFVSLPGFGTFATRARPARTGRNPRTGESVEIAASTVLAFKPGKTLRDHVNGAG